MSLLKLAHRKTVAQALTLSRLLACSSWWKPAAMLCVALGEAHVEGSEGRFQTTASKELKPSAQQPVRNWIQLTTT